MECHIMILFFCPRIPFSGRKALKMVDVLKVLLEVWADQNNVIIEMEETEHEGQSKESTD